MGGYWSSVPILPADQHIVIVGAGYGGASLGLELLKHKANFTIISPRDCFHHNIGSLRAPVQPGEFVNSHYGESFPWKLSGLLNTVVGMLCCRFHKKDTDTSGKDIWRTFQKGKSGGYQTTRQTGVFAVP